MPNTFINSYPVFQETLQEGEKKIEAAADQEHEKEDHEAEEHEYHEEEGAGEEEDNIDETLMDLEQATKEPSPAYDPQDCSSFSFPCLGFHIWSKHSNCSAQLLLLVLRIDRRV